MTYYDGQYHLDEDDIVQAIADWLTVPPQNVGLYVSENDILADVIYNQEEQQCEQTTT